MSKIALVDKYARGTNYTQYFPQLEYDEYHLSSKNKKKLLKADKDIQIDPDKYDYIILVGAEPTKHFAPTASVTSHQGYLVDDKYLPIIDPSMLKFKPSMEKSFNHALDNIKKYLDGSMQRKSNRKCIGIEDTTQAIKALKEILALNITPVAIDTETSALYPRDGHLLGVSISANIFKGYYISSDVFDEECCELLQNIVYKHHIVFQNAKFDMSWLEYHLGVNFNSKLVKDYTDFEDTMLQHYCLDESQGTHDLKQMAIKYTDLGDYDLELELFKKQYCRTHKVKVKDFTYDLIPFEVMYPYACTDAMATLELYIQFKEYIEKGNLTPIYNLLKQGSKFLQQVENNGVPFCVERLKIAQEMLNTEIYELEQSIYQYKEIKEVEEKLSVKFNPGSTAHLAFLFFVVLGLEPLKKTEGGAWSTDAETLEYLSDKHPIVNLIGKIKKAKKIKSTYIDKIITTVNRDGRLRTFFNLTTTTSGRLSSSGKINMQQLPRDNKIVKACIKARPGYKIISQDLATAEMYVAAVLSGDKNLQKVFIDKQAGRGADFHSTIAHMVFRLPCDVSEVKSLFPGLRQAAKAISFGILYGSGPQKVADTVNADGDGSFTLQDAQDAIEKYFGTFPQLKKWLKSKKLEIETNGYIWSAFGRKRRLGDVFSGNRAVQGHEVRSGINFLVQSVASDINLIAGIHLQDFINTSGIDAKIFGLVHDSILAEVKEEDIPVYLEKAAEFTQADYGVSIPGCPIGVDQEIGDDYSFTEGVFA